MSFYSSCYPVTLLQIEDRQSPFFRGVKERNSTYCSLHPGISHVYMSEGKDNVPCYWSKVFETARILNQTKEEHAIMWMDSDAFVKDMHCDIRSIMAHWIYMHKTNTGYEPGMIISKNLPPWDFPFNAGVFIVLNNDAGHLLINEWMKLYNAQVWDKKNYPTDTERPCGGWQCTANEDCNWAGMNYEEGSFINGILSRHDLAKLVVSLPYHVLQEPDWENPTAGCFSFHLAGHHKQKGVQALTKYNAQIGSHRQPLTRSFGPVFIVIICIITFFLVLCIIKFYKKLHR